MFFTCNKGEILKITQQTGNEKKDIPAISNMTKDHNQRPVKVSSRKLSSPSRYKIVKKTCYTDANGLIFSGTHISLLYLKKHPLIQSMK